MLVVAGDAVRVGAGRRSGPRPGPFRRGGAARRRSSEPPPSTARTAAPPSRQVLQRVDRDESRCPVQVLQHRCGSASPVPPGQVWSSSTAPSPCAGRPRPRRRAIVGPVRARLPVLELDVPMHVAVPERRRCTASTRGSSAPSPNGHRNHGRGSGRWPGRWRRGARRHVARVTRRSRSSGDPRVIVGVVSDQVSLVGDPARGRRVRLGPSPLDEERRAHAGVTRARRGCARRCRAGTRVGPDAPHRTSARRAGGLTHGWSPSTAWT